MFSGLHFYIDCSISGGLVDTSTSLKRQIERFGGSVASRWNPKITHLIWSNGKAATVDKYFSSFGAQHRPHVVGPLWIDKCISEGALVDWRPHVMDLPVYSVLLANENRRKSMEPSRSGSSSSSSAFEFPSADDSRPKLGASKSMPTLPTAAPAAHSSGRSSTSSSAQVRSALALVTSSSPLPTGPASGSALLHSAAPSRSAFPVARTALPAASSFEPRMLRTPSQHAIKTASPAVTSPSSSSSGLPVTSHNVISLITPDPPKSAPVATTSARSIPSPPLTTYGKRSAVAVKMPVHFQAVDRGTTVLKLSGDDNSFDSLLATATSASCLPTNVPPPMSDSTSHRRHSAGDALNSGAKPYAGTTMSRRTSLQYSSSSVSAATALVAMTSESQSSSRSTSAGKKAANSVSGLSSLAQMKMPVLLKKHEPQTEAAASMDVISPLGSIVVAGGAMSDGDANRTKRRSVASKPSPVTLASSRPSPPPLSAASSARQPVQLRKRGHTEIEVAAVAADVDSAVSVAPARNGRSESKANRRVVDDNNDNSDDVIEARATDHKRSKSAPLPIASVEASASVKDVDMSSSLKSAKVAATAAATLRTAPKRASKSPSISSLPSWAASPAASPASSCASSSPSSEVRSSARVAAHASKSVASAVKTAPMIFAVSGAGADVKAALATVVEILGNTSSARICAPTSNEFTHLILEKTGRTAKVLFALARGAWILKADYISACLDAGRFLPELEFLIPDLANARLARERLAKLALPASGAGRASSSSDGGSDNSDSSSSHGGLLTLQNDSFRRVYMHGELVMSSAVMSELIAACGGLTVSTFAQCTICISAVPLPAGKTKGGANAPIVTPEWLFDSLSNYSLQDLASYAP